MSLWLLGLVIAGAGAAGGLVNALLTDNGFVLPKSIDAQPTRIWKPGFVGNMVIGAAAAFVTWGLYGRWAGAVIAGAAPGSGPREVLRDALRLHGRLPRGCRRREDPHRRGGQADPPRHGEQGRSGPAGRRRRDRSRPRTAVGGAAGRAERRLGTGSVRLRRARARPS